MVSSTMLHWAGIKQEQSRWIWVPSHTPRMCTVMLWNWLASYCVYYNKVYLFHCPWAFHSKMIIELHVCWCACRFASGGENTTEGCWGRTRNSTETWGTHQKKGSVLSHQNFWMMVQTFLFREKKFEQVLLHYQIFLEKQYVSHGFFSSSKFQTIKQTIMTSVYGVTMYGAKLQIYKQINPLSDEALPSEFHMPASVYLARCAFKALEEMFSSARSIQVCDEDKIGM